MISGLLGLQTEDTYRRARKVLNERFGDPFRIYEAYRERLKTWPLCTTGAELQEFSNFVVMTQETMKTVKYLKEFDNFSAIRELAVRLPVYYSNKWRQSAKKVEASEGEYTFKDFVDYIQEAARDATHPVFSHEALAAARREVQKESTKGDKKKYERKRSGGTTFASTTFNGAHENDDNGQRPQLQLMLQTTTLATFISGRTKKATLLSCCW